MNKLVIFKFLIAACFSLPAQSQVDQRMYQSPVRNAGPGPSGMAFAVCDLMETFAGVPERLDAQALAQAPLPAGGGLATFFNYQLEAVGLRREEPSIAPNDSTTPLTRYHCLPGTVLVLTKAGKVSDPKKVANLLQSGVKGVVMSYDYCAKDWRKGRWQLGKQRGKHRPEGQHAVLIVGFRDSTFLFKNSWGEAWGDDGYGEMSFAYHRSHAVEGLTAYLAEATPPQTAQVAGLGLKTQLEILDGKPYVQVSLVPQGPGIAPRLSNVSYLLTPATPADPPVQKNALLLETARSTGYPCLLPIPTADARFNLLVRITLQGDPVHHEIRLTDLPAQVAEYPLDLK